MEALYFFPILLHEHQRRQERRRLLLIRRGLRDAHNPFELDEVQFKRLFRLTKDIARCIIEEVSPRLQRRRSNALRIHVQVLIALRFFATGSYQRCVGQDLCVGQSKVSNCIRNVSRALVDILAHRYIKFPRTFEKRQAIKNRFMVARGFPGVIGCIDCTHIRIVEPAVREEAFFNNHHRSHSINVQAICDHDLNILSFSARYPGSVHDQYIWNSSRTKEIMQGWHNEGIRNTWLLGDSGYALQPYLLTPVRQAAPNSPEERYTACHCRTRNCVERLFGVMKNMWRCLLSDRVLHYTPEVAGMITTACAVLHNYALKHRMELPEDEIPQLEFVEHNVVGVEDDALGAENARRMVIQQFFS